MTFNKHLVAITIVSVISLFFTSSAFADVISPKKQIELKISVVNVSCKQGFVKVIKSIDNTPACVKPSTAEKLQSLGWAKQVDPKKIEAEKIRLEAPAIGEIKRSAAIKQPGEAGRLETTPRTIGYNFIFEACAFDKTIREPQVLINSDSESKQVQLANQILANTCQTNVVKIKAINPDSIKGTLTSKGKITDKITGLENNIADLQKQISDERNNLSKLTSQEITPELRQMVSESSKKIGELRSQLNGVKGEYNTYLFALHVDSKSLSQFRTPVAFEVTKIEGVTFSTVNTYQQIDSSERPYGYNVVFKVCSDKTTIRVPQVKITSDVETTTVNLADKIPSGTCQTSIGKIKANNIKNINYELGTSGKISSSINDIEKNIDLQQKTLASLKEELSQITRIVQKPFDYEQQVADLTNEIVDLRNKINSNRAQLAQYNLQHYQ